MTVIVEVPGHGEVEFPDGMSEAEMEAAIRKNFMLPPKQQPKRDFSAIKTREQFNQLSPDDQKQYYKETQKRYKERGWGSGIPKLGYDVGGKVTDVTGSPALGFAANVATQAIPALLSSFNVGAGPVASATEKPAAWMMQNAVKPHVDDLSSGAADKAVKTMLEETISPTRGGMVKTNKIVDKLHKQVEEGVAASPAEVSVEAVGQRLLPTYERAVAQANPKPDLAAIKQAWEDFVESPLVAGQEKIPVQVAHAIKRGTQQSLGSKSYGELGSAAIEAQKGIARGLREETAEAVPNIVEALKREAALMNVKDVAMARALMEANKNPLGLAGLRMDNPLSATTFLADRMAALKALLAHGLYATGKPTVATPLGMTVGEALQNRGLYSE